MKVKVTVYGSGNEDLMVKLVRDHLKVDYELPLGGARLAYLAAEAGHDVILCDPSLNLSEESRERLESAGVELVTDDTVGAEHGEVQILFTPFGRTVDIVRRLLDDVREGAVFCTTCTCSPMALYYGLEDELRKEREDVGISSFHPAGIPGTETQDLILVADTRSEESGIELATEEQVERCVNLAEDMGYDVYVLDPELVPPIGDMSIVFTVRIVQAICNYYSAAKICGAPNEMIEEQVNEVLSAMAYLFGKYGLDALDRMDGDLLLRSLRNMKLTEDTERLVNFFERCYLDLLNGDRESVRELSTMMVPPNKLIDHVRDILGDAPIQYARRKFFEELQWGS